MMAELAIPQHPGSPFDALRRLDADGEHWMAREVNGPLTYTWRGFTDAIERGRIALRTNGQDPDIHIKEWNKPSNGFGRGRTQTDYRLTREGVYAIIQGGDPRKPEIAAAWAYFRTRTRQAELIPQRRGSFGTAIAIPDTYTYDEVCALLRQYYGIDLTVTELTRNLRAGGVLKQNGSPTKKYKFLFWFVEETGAWAIHKHVIPQVAFKVHDTGREMQDFRFLQARLELEGVGQNLDSDQKRLAA